METIDRGRPRGWWRRRVWWARYLAYAGKNPRPARRRLSPPFSPAEGSAR